jgi:type I restriction enzyme, R subunit
LIAEEEARLATQTPPSELLTRPEPKLNQAQEIAVKKVARELLEKLKEHLAVFRWRDFQQTRAAVRAEIRVRLNELPEEPYPHALWDQKVDNVWQFVFIRYPGPPRAGAVSF